MCGLIGLILTFGGFIRTRSMRRRGGGRDVLVLTLRCKVSGASPRGWEHASWGMIGLESRYVTGRPVLTALWLQRFVYLPRAPRSD